jgi:hypothetical protein
LKKGNNSLAASIPTLPGAAFKGGGKTRTKLNGYKTLFNSLFARQPD